MRTIVISLLTIHQPVFEMVVWLFQTDYRIIVVASGLILHFLYKILHLCDLCYV